MRERGRSSSSMTAWARAAAFAHPIGRPRLPPKIFRPAAFPHLPCFGADDAVDALAALDGGALGDLAPGRSAPPNQKASGRCGEARTASVGALTTRFTAKP